MSELSFPPPPRFFLNYLKNPIWADSKNKRKNLFYAISCLAALLSNSFANTDSGDGGNQYLHDKTWIFLPSDNLLVACERCLELSNRLFPSCLKPLFQSEAKCEAIDMKMMFNYDAIRQQRFRT